jgi:hypothetical protein
MKRAKKSTAEAPKVKAIEKPAVEDEDSEQQQPAAAEPLPQDPHARALLREQLKREGEQAMAEYHAKHEAEVKKIARLRAARLATEAKSKGKTKGK